MLTWLVLAVARLQQGSVGWHSASWPRHSRFFSPVCKALSPPSSSPSGCYWLIFACPVIVFTAECKRAVFFVSVWCAPGRYRLPLLPPLLLLLCLS